MRATEATRAGVPAKRAATRAKVVSKPAAAQPPDEEESTLWDECFPGKACFFDEMTPEEVDEFNAEAEETEREVGHNYRSEADGHTVDDLIARVEKKASEGDSVDD